jgi:hypothetical protein
VVTALIQAVGLVYQAAFAAPVVSTTMETTGTGGLLQSPVPTPGFPNHGIVDWAEPPTVSTEETTFDSSAFLLVASGIKT